MTNPPPAPMTETTIFGVWLTSDDYLAGDMPTSIDGSRNQALANARDVLQGRSMLIAEKDDFGTWVPLAFFGMGEKSYRPVSKAQIPKYVEKRSKNMSEMRPPEVDSPVTMLSPENPPRQFDDEGNSTGEFEPLPEPPAPVHEVEGKLNDPAAILTITPQMAKLLSETFALVSQGRPVMVKLIDGDE